MPLPSGRIAMHLRDLRTKLNSLTPQKTAGLLTSHTTRGVTRRPMPQIGSRGGRGRVARWA